MSFNLASAWEAVAEAVPDAEAAITGSTVRTWRELEQRAARVAGALHGHDIGAGANVGLCLYNGNEYLEAQFGAFKQRATPFNVNYRYTAHELRDLLLDADAVAVFFDAVLADRFAQARAELPDVRLWVQVGGADTVPSWAVGFEAMVAAAMPAEPIERSPDDLWMLYTGGTTGRPKGVLWPHGSMVGTMKPNYSGMRLSLPTTVDEVVARVDDVVAKGFVPRQLAASPLMHGTAGISALTTFLQGGCVISLTGHHFDADELWQTVQDRRATLLTIVGDAFGRPMVDALDRAAAAGTPYDLSSVFVIMSSGVIWSAPVKEALLGHNPRMRLLDSLGSSEGVGFAKRVEGDATTVATARFELGPDTTVLTDDGREVEPGSGELGRLALGGNLPLGYYKDPAKSAETFPTINGRRFSIPGDWATVEADGTITLLGRGSVCINTGGEKVYPEEVEEALKLHPAVVDVNVVGVPDERWGQAVTAVVELSDEAVADTEILAAVRTELAGYKVPKRLIRVPAIRRGPNGKADYRWARTTAEQGL